MAVEPQVPLTSTPAESGAVAVSRAPGWIRLCLTVAGVVLVFGGLLISNVGGDMVSQTISNVGLCVGALSAAIACLFRARHTTGRLRISWGLIGLGILSWGFGQVAWVYLESIRGMEVPFPSAADFGYIGLPPLVIAGLLFFPVVAQSLATRIRTVLDGLMIGTSALVISWIFVVAPTIKAAGEDGALALYISLWYPLGDVVVLTVVLFQLALLRHRGHGMGRPLLLVGIGITIFSIADSGFAYLNLTGSYASGGVIDTFWFLGFAFILLAALMPAPGAAEMAADQEDVDEDEEQQPYTVLLPYVAVLVALGTSVFWFATTTNGATPMISWTRSALILLMVLRQVLTLLENWALTRHLKARVVEVSASEQRFHALVQHSSDVVTVVDPDARVFYQSESVRRVFGYSATTLTGRTLTKLLDPESGRRLAEALRAVAGRPYGTTVLELTVRHRDRGLRQAEMTVTNLLDDPNVGGLVLNTRDISERKELQEQLVHEAYHDALTQLANRALFHEMVGEALNRVGTSGAVTVLFLDLDGFKEVNDSLGHAAGDHLLVQVADRLRTCVRTDDTIARFGGDEFAVLVEAPRRGDAEDIAERVVAAMDAPFLLDDRDLHIGASVGLACSSDDAAAASDAEQLMRDADLAMYRAKSLGGGNWAAYDPEMHTDLVARLELEADLRRALDRDEIALHYQPTIDLADGRIVGFEALVRWHHPVRGMISPGEFIPVAETTGLITPLGRWVLEEACRQAVAWGADKRPLKMSVNVSVRQFERADLPTVVAAVLEETGMPADQLCLEMTESVLMKDTEENLAQLIRLKELGVQLAIDDFGTGYSSLAYLRRFPVDAIKIDRSFVERLGHEADESTLAQTIVQLGQSLGMSTVAEGIEELAQLTALRRMGCELAQGFYFSRPVPAKEAGVLLSKAAARMPDDAPLAA